MFERIKFTIKVSRILKTWDADPNHLTLSEKIVIGTLLYVIALSGKDSQLLSNRYACADAVFLVSAYASYFLYDFDDTDDDIFELQRKTIDAVCREYAFDRSDVISIASNRFDCFHDLLLNSDENIALFIDHAIQVLIRDLRYTRFERYSVDTPLIVLDMHQLYQIQAEANSFFHRAFATVNDTLREYSQEK